MNESDKLLRHGLILEYLTLGWNVAGVVVVACAAINSGSVALTGFALDSLIEIGASIVVVWELTGVGRGREKKALRFIAVAFFILAAYVLAQSGRTLLVHIKPDTSKLGIAWLFITCAAMTWLAREKRSTGTKLANPVLLAEGRVTMVDAWLAGAVLLGLVLNAVCGWWWADPVAALVLVFYGGKEGYRVWKESATLDPGHHN